MYCHKMVSDLVKIKPDLENNEQPQANNQPGFQRKLKPLEEVTCYKVLNIFFNLGINYFSKICIHICIFF